MKRKNPKRKSISRQIIKIVLISMGAVFLFQIFMIVVIMRDNVLRRREATEAAAVSVAASLDIIGQNLQGLGRYLSNYEAFRQLFLADRRVEANPAIFVAQAFHTVMYMTDHFPMIVDVMVVPTAGVPFTFYTGHGYEMLEIIAQVYDFTDTMNLESRFLYFEGLDYFVYTTPITQFVTPGAGEEKFATSVIVGDKDFIIGMIEGGGLYHFLHFGVFDGDGRIIASNSPYIDWPYSYEEYFISVNVYSMGLTVRALDDQPWAAAPDVVMFVSFIIFSLFILAVVIGLVIYLLNREIARPISSLVQEMGAWEGTTLKKRLSSSRITEIDRLITGFNNMLGEIETGTNKIFTTQERLYEMEIRKNETEIYALQSQINPHFLFNTLQCIRSLAIMRNADNIAQITLSMSEMLRYAMHYQEEVTIREEIEIIRHYTLICDIRFQGRFRFEIEFDPEVLDRNIGRMTLQPLVENAVMHGVSRMEEGGVVHIKGGVDGGKIWIKIEDNGPGIEAERLEVIESALALGFAETLQTGKGHSFGLYNINRRLKLLYGDKYGINIGREEGMTAIKVEVPA